MSLFEEMSILVSGHEGEHQLKHELSHVLSKIEDEDQYQRIVECVGYLMDTFQVIKILVMERQKKKPDILPDSAQQLINEHIRRTRILD